LFLLASRRPILLRNRPNFLGLKCVCTQKRLFLVNKRLLHQILSINENTCTWFDILAVQKCQLQCFQTGSARLAMGIVTRSARFSSVRSISARLGLACSMNEALCPYTYESGSRVWLGSGSNESNSPVCGVSRDRIYSCVCGEIYPSLAPESSSPRRTCEPDSYVYGHLRVPPDSAERQFGLHSVIMFPVPLRI